MPLPSRPSPPRPAPLHALRLACAAAVALGASAARAEDGLPDFATGAAAEARQRYAQQSEVPDGYDRAAVERLLVPEPLARDAEQVEVLDRLEVKPWKASPGLSVAALRTSILGKAQIGSGADETASTIRVAVFSGGTAGEAPALRARGVFEGPADRRLSGLDLALYRLAPKVLAIGVRTKTEFLFGSGGGRDEHLTLYVQQGSDLREVWTTLMVSWQDVATDWNPEGSRNRAENGVEEPATISVLPGTSHGFHDLRKTLGHRSAVFRWNGTTYATQGRDPVPPVNPSP